MEEQLSDVISKLNQLIAQNNDWEAQLFDIMKYLLPSLVVFGGVFVLVKKFMENEMARMQAEIKKESVQVSLPLRLQAYERLSLLLERISLYSLVPRVHTQQMTARDLQAQLYAAVRSEFEHNLSQQIYVSGSVWEATKAAKDESLKIINLAASKMDDSKSGMDLTNVIFAILKDLEGSPTDKALKALKAEVRKTF